MDYETLLALLGENADAVNFVKQVQADASANVSTINTLETQLVEVKNTRDEYKGHLKNVKTKLGLDQLNDETLATVLDKKGGDEALKTELENLKTQLETVEQAGKKELEALNTSLRDANFDREMLRMGVSANAVNDHALGTIMRELKTGADFNEDGSIFYKNDDGSTRYMESSSTKMGLSERLAEIKSKPEFSYLFKDKSAGGSGPSAGSGGGGGAPTKGIGGDKADRVKHIQSQLDAQKT